METEAEVGIESQAFTAVFLTITDTALRKKFYMTITAKQRILELARWFSISIFAKTNIYIRRHYRGVSLREQL